MSRLFLVKWGRQTSYPQSRFFPRGTLQQTGIFFPEAELDISGNSRMIGRKFLPINLFAVSICIMSLILLGHQYENSFAICDSYEFSGEGPEYDSYLYENSL